MLSPTMVCGYIFDLCEETRYELLTTSEFQDEILSTKPSFVRNNSFIDDIYSKSNPSTLPPTFRVLFFSDFEIDMDYATNSSVSLGCHGNKTDSTIDRAPVNGTKKCYMPLEGFKRMVDTINSFNNTLYLDISSIIYAGGTNVYQPGYLNETSVNLAHAEAIKYLREKNPLKGIYYSLGSNDLYPPNLQYFNELDSELKLSTLDETINPTAEIPEEESIMDNYSSISDDVDARTKFKEYGFYSKLDFIYKVDTDGSRPAKSQTPFFKTDLRVIFLNTNACNNRNLALMEEVTDPGG